MLNNLEHAGVLKQIASLVVNRCQVSKVGSALIGIYDERHSFDFEVVREEQQLHRDLLAKHGVLQLQRKQLPDIHKHKKTKQ